MENIYYFSVISKIGGIEQFFYELSKEFGIHGKNADLTIVYKYADPQQLERLRRNVRCIQYHDGMKLECKRAFFNFNMDIIDNVQAEEYILVVHGNYEQLHGRVPKHDKITKVIAVSKDSAEAYERLTGIKCEHCYNPIEIEPVKPVIHLVSACRMDDPVKGAYRVRELAKAMDDYCRRKKRQYIWTIFTNPTDKLDSPNVVLMQPRIDIRPFLADADIVVQLSDNYEGYCYTAVEAALYGSGKGKPQLLTTPCNVYKETGIAQIAKSFDFECTNLEEVVRWIFEEDKETYTYKAPKNGWAKLLGKEKSTYKDEMSKSYKVEAIRDGIDMERDCNFTTGDQWEVDYIRLQELLGANESSRVFVKLID